MDVEKSLVYRNNAEREHTFLVFALQKDTTRNPRIVDFVSRITMTSPLKVIWKVRRLLNEENDLLKQLETKKSNGK